MHKLFLILIFFLSYVVNQSEVLKKITDSFNAGCLSSYKRAIYSFNTLYQTKKIYFKNFSGFETTSFLNYLMNCDKCGECETKRLLFINYAHHIPIQKALITTVISNASKLGYENIIFIDNPPVVINEKPISNLINNTHDPQYNIMKLEAKSLGYKILNISNHEILKDVLTNTNKICDLYYNSNFSKTLIISNTTFNMDNYEVSEYERLIISQLKLMFGNQVFSFSQTEDLNDYNKSEWHSIHQAYILWNIKKNKFFTASPHFDAFLFNSTENTRSSIKELLDYYKIKINSENEKVKFLKLYRIRNQSKLSPNEEELVDIMPSSPNHIMEIIIKPKTLHLLRYIDKYGNIIKEKQIEINNL